MADLKIHGPNNMWSVKTDDPAGITDKFGAGEVFAVHSFEGDPWGKVEKTIYFNPSLVVAIEVIETGS